MDKLAAEAGQNSGCRPGQLDRVAARAAIDNARLPPAAQKSRIGPDNQTIVANSEFDRGAEDARNRAEIRHHAVAVADPDAGRIARYRRSGAIHYNPALLQLDAIAAQPDDLPEIHDRAAGQCDLDTAGTARNRGRGSTGAAIRDIAATVEFYAVAALAGDSAEICYLAVETEPDAGF
ncbi:MAG TPA: hypothetical protein VFQ82_10140, partial [Stellaceae bacterium]|nr:hypothetical protein [Stellaceae bacterium]